MTPKEARIVAMQRLLTLPWVKLDCLGHTNLKLWGNGRPFLAKPYIHRFLQDPAYSSQVQGVHDDIDHTLAACKQAACKTGRCANENVFMTEAGGIERCIDLRVEFKEGHHWA
ncbi:hypothetical protein NYP20_14950 [Pseudomonas sp. N3-W]|nr:hypothetical protein [Pseudomonas sp. N3-W]UWF46657.1 hypothetical protein NYP20_14950 [Pseudomonas sp. N3-W]